MNKYYLFILGCQMNHSDAQRLRTVLNSAGYSETTDEKSADLIIVVACSVRQSAIDRIHGKLVRWNRLKTKNYKLKTALTGCVLPADKKKFANRFDIVFNISQMKQLPSLISKNKKLQTKNFESLKTTDYFKILPSKTSQFSANIPIMTGCDNFCSYCAVPFTRGREVSRPQKEIIAEAKNLISRGYKDITLLGQNVNSYKYDFVKLLQEIDKIKGDYWIRFISNHPKDFSLELIKFFNTTEHFAPFIHLPVQSGSDKILKTMKRPYKIADYIKLAQKIKKEIPDVCLTTDVIVGFPGETKVDFAKSCALFHKIKYDMAFISQYSPRQGTIAARLKDDVPKAEKKRREKEINDILTQTALENNQKLIGKKIKTLVEHNLSDKKYSLARTSTLKSVKANNPNLPIGEFVNVKITSATAWKLEGK